MLLLIDNYDSFTYNLYQYLAELGEKVEVVRNDRTSIEAIEAAAPESIVISPGPGTPADAGISVDVVRHFAGKVPILGVCLGHQCIGQAFGGRIVHAGELLHGKSSQIHHRDVGVFAGLPQRFSAVRYHSLVVEQATLPSSLEVTAWTDNGLIMGLRHRDYPIEGVQFHPESILTRPGKDLLRNFLELAGSRKSVAAFSS